MSELFVCWPSTRPVAECDRHPHGTRRCIKSVEHWIHTTDSGRHGLPGGQYLDNPGHRCAVFRGYSDIALPGKRCHCSIVLIYFQVSDNSRPLALLWSSTTNEHDCSCAKKASSEILSDEACRAASRCGSPDAISPFTMGITPLGHPASTCVSPTCIAHHPHWKAISQDPSAR